MPNKARRLRLQEYLPYRLSVAANAVSGLIARGYESRFKLRIPQWRLIAVLADEGPLTQQSLCGRTIMDKVTVMRAAQGLLRRRLVRRLPNERDGRSHRLQLTATGLRLYRQIVPLALDYQARLLAGLEREEILRLEAALKRLEECAVSLQQVVAR
ncbi:MAG TPA: MarR family winged helix-turn-helix transcriptional regulator [Steroidobacteraceae bacterium]|jgi:DNA-binding MarR family transcriptional regulator|nr:MarR family winged helix-turn-helix transcriptional regulator [Steroidobacteraceae bacterium]